MYAFHSRLVKRILINLDQFCFVEATKCPLPGRAYLIPTRAFR